MVQTAIPTHGGNLKWAAAIAQCSPGEILDFSASINPLGPPQSVLNALQNAIENQRALTAYPDPNYTRLREAIAQHHHIDPDWIFPGNGAAELFTWIARDCVNCSTVYLPVPAFADYGRALKALDIPITPIPLSLEPGNTHLPWARSPRPPSALWLNNPHNPTGRLWSADTIRQRLAETAEALELVAIDEAFMDFLPPEQQQSLIHQVTEYPQLVIVRSLTKFYSIPGLRLGYAIAHPDRLKRWQTWRDPWCVNALAEVAGLAALGDRDFVQKTWRWLSAARENLQQRIGQLPGMAVYPGAANYLLVKSAVSVSAMQQQLLMGDAIAIRNCATFPELGDRYFRVAVRTPSQNEQLVSALCKGLRATQT
ncbi:MAG: threonine-phosphate decarboxylase CobD [Cyanophyceae cyanobacterium]